jgi:hypothetical protein
MGTFLRRIALTILYFGCAAQTLAYGGELPPSVDEGKHYATALGAYDMLRPSYLCSSRGALWARGWWGKGSFSRADGASEDLDEGSFSVGCKLATARILFLPLAASSEIFAYRRGDGGEGGAGHWPAIDGRVYGGGGSVAMQLLGLNLRLCAAYEGIKSTGDGGESLRSHGLNGGIFVFQQLIPLGPITLGPDFALFASRVTTGDEKITWDRGGGTAAEIVRNFKNFNNWRFAPGAAIVFEGPGHSGFRLGCRWNWDLSKRPQESLMIPFNEAAKDIIDAFNNLRKKTGPKSGFGEVELSVALNLSRSFFAEFSGTSYSGKRRGVRATISGGLSF